MLIEDARENGHALRATWHPDTRQFVVSTWNHDVCTGSARLRAEDAAELAALLVDGLADAATPAGLPVAAPAARAGLGGFVDRLRWLVQGTPPARPAGRAPRSRSQGTAPPLAAVRPLRRPPA